MHHLVPCIATSVQYFPNVVAKFCNGYLIFGKILIFVNIYFIICGATTFIVRHRSVPNNAHLVNKVLKY